VAPPDSEKSQSVAPPDSEKSQSVAPPDSEKSQSVAPYIHGYEVWWKCKFITFVECGCGGLEKCIFG